METNKEKRERKKKGERKGGNEFRKSGHKIERNYKKN